ASPETRMWPREPTAMRLSPNAAMSRSSVFDASGATHDSSTGAAGAASSGSASSDASSARRAPPCLSASPHATSRQLARLIVRRGALDREVVASRLLVLQAECEVAAVAEIHDGLERGPQ